MKAGNIQGAKRCWILNISTGFVQNREMESGGLHVKEKKNVKKKGRRENTDDTPHNINQEYF